MAKRTRLGIHYSYNENWIGGTYYIHNLLKAILTLPETDLPIITVFAESEQEFVKLAKDTQYPNMNYWPLFKLPKYNLLEKIINKIARAFFKQNLIDKAKNMVDVVFPVMTTSHEYFGKKKVYWIPDFQDRKLPAFFKVDELAERKKWQVHVSKQKALLILSSQDAADQFQYFLPHALTTQRVVPFATIQQTNEIPSFEEVKSIFQLPDAFLISPNQFWAHKNHIIILKAVRLLKQKGHLVTVVFTGKEYDYRNPDYFGELQYFVKQNDLEEQVRFLGFIDRLHQLCLMKQAKAIIQPSLFEGWSSVIEDAKCLGKQVLASNLPVHQEQLGDNGKYFDPTDETLLANLIEEILNCETISINYQYELQIQQFAENFLRAIA